MDRLLQAMHSAFEAEFAASHSPRVARDAPTVCTGGSPRWRRNAPPVDAARLRETINRANERLDRADLGAEDAEHVRAAADEYDRTALTPRRRIPVRKKNDIAA